MPPMPGRTTMEPASRTPEGEPNRCPICGNQVVIDPSRPPGDAPCPHCGHLLWFAGPPAGELSSTSRLPWEGLEHGQVALPARRGDASESASLWRVVCIAAAVGFVIALPAAFGVARNDDFPALARLGIAVVSAVVSVLTALGLSVRDALLLRMWRGQHVTLLLRLYFTSGWGTLMVWIVTAIELTFVVAMVLASWS